MKVLACFGLFTFSLPVIPALFFEETGFTPDNPLFLDYGENHPMDPKRRQHRRRLDDVGEIDLEYDGDADLYQPLRIHFITDLLEERRDEENDESFDLFVDKILNVYLPEAASSWSQALRVVPVRGTIPVEQDSCYGIHGDWGPVTTVSDADLVVVVSAQDILMNGDYPDPVCESGALAMASACTLDQFDRPVVGFMNYCYRDTHYSGTAASLQNAFLPPFGIDPGRIESDSKGVALHEMAHILGFASWLYKYYRMPDGTPRTSRPFEYTQVTCSNGRTRLDVFPQNLFYFEDNPDGTRSYFIATTRVRRVVQNHINCSTIFGAELQRETCIGSHWSERYFMGEVMSPAISAASENVLSALTLALMEDSSWYKVDYQNARTQVFGLAAGCDFVNNACIQDDDVPSWGAGMFCSRPISFESDDQISQGAFEAVGCDVGHRSWTLCDLWQEPTVPNGFVEIPDTTIRYFSDQSLVSAYSFTSSCPAPIRPLGVDCTAENGPYQAFYVGEKFGPESRCIHATQTNQRNRPACLPVKCDASLRKVVLVISGEEHICEADGDIILSRFNSGARFTCPRLAAVCPELVGCPGSCSGRGTCVYDELRDPQCECDADVPDRGENPGCFPFWAGRKQTSSPSSETRAEPTSSPTDIQKGNTSTINGAVASGSAEMLGLSLVLSALMTAIWTCACAL